MQCNLNHSICIYSKGQRSSTNSIISASRGLRIITLLQLKCTCPPQMKMTNGPVRVNGQLTAFKISLTFRTWSCNANFFYPYHIVYLITVDCCNCCSPSLHRVRQSYRVWARAMCWSEPWSEVRSRYPAAPPGSPFEGRRSTCRPWCSMGTTTLQSSPFCCTGVWWTIILITGTLTRFLTLEIFLLDQICTIGFILHSHKK